MQFQPSAWYDEQVMKAWVNEQWKLSCEGEMLLVAEVHDVQTRDAVLTLLKQDCNTEVELVPPGVTGIVQLLYSIITVYVDMTK